MSTVRIALAGLIGALAVAGLWWATGGAPDARAALIAGLVATGAQTMAHLWLAGVPAAAPASQMWRRHLHGTALRIGGAAVVVMLVLKDRTTFPPLATVLSFAGVLFGLLVLEIRMRA